MRKLIWPSLLVLGICVNCAILKPGADPFVVRVEQTQTIASGAFDVVLRVDNADRGFWRTNAPAFHQFCEWLRTPVPYGPTPVPRCIAMQLNVDDLKLVYKANRDIGSSNSLWLVWSVLSTTFSQASSWSNIVTLPTH